MSGDRRSYKSSAADSQPVLREEYMHNSMINGDAWKWLQILE